MIQHSENVARAIFSPRMIVKGEIQPEAFRLRPSIAEDYISVMRMSHPKWMDDIRKIPQHKNRRLYGFAEMNVGEIKNTKLKSVEFEVSECPTEGTGRHRAKRSSCHIEIGTYNTISTILQVTTSL